LKGGERATKFKEEDHQERDDQMRGVGEEKVVEFMSKTHMNKS
jgi:hypothetical protein